jgi:hypothetical protein
MGTDTIEKIKKLPLDKQKEVDDFIDFLVEKYHFNSKEVLSLGDKRAKNMGWAKGSIWMADDFNETPDDFKDYM